MEQRRTIERCYRMGLSLDQIASIIDKHKSTVSLELARSFSAPGSRSPRARTARGGGAGYRRVYDAERAQRYAEVKGRRAKLHRLDHAPLREQVWELLRADWSPEQIAEELPRLFPDDPDMRVSHETIYQSLFVQTKGELKRELTAHLRTGPDQAQAADRWRQATTPWGSPRRSGSPHARPRPSTGPCPGHWEGDLLLGGTGKGGGDHLGLTFLPLRCSWPCCQVGTPPSIARDGPWPR